MFFPNRKERRALCSLLSEVPESGLRQKNVGALAAAETENRKKHLSLPHGQRLAAAAGISVETLLVLPLFLFGMVTMITFLDLFRIETVHLSRLCEKAKQEGLLEAGAGAAKRPEILLTDQYELRPPGLLLPLGSIQNENHVCLHCWTGQEEGERFSGTVGDESEKMVFITETGHVIHFDRSCSYLHLSVRQISGEDLGEARNEYGARYHACSLCSRGQPPSSVVYVTSDGTSYHNSGSCSGLKRTVLLVRESEVADWKHCSRCG